MQFFLGEFGIIRKMKVIFLYDCLKLRTNIYDEYVKDVQSFKNVKPEKYESFKTLLKC